MRSLITLGAIIALAVSCFTQADNEAIRLKLTALCLFAWAGVSLLTEILASHPDKED